MENDYGLKELANNGISWTAVDKGASRNAVFIKLHPAIKKAIEENKTNSVTLHIVYK